MRIVSMVLSALLLLTPVAQTFSAGQKTDKQKSPIEQIKIKIAKLGVGQKARATITTKDGARTKGFVYSAGEDDFVMRDRKTAAPTTIRDADVIKVDVSRSHSVARKSLI